MPEPIGDLAGGLLLDFFLEEIGALVYNQAIAAAQSQMLRRVSDLNSELYADEFQYWPRVEKKRKSSELMSGDLPVTAGPLPAATSSEGTNPPLTAGPW